MPGPKPAALVDRLLAWRVVEPINGCWLPWSWSLTGRDKYFRITYKGKKELIHRLSAVAFLDFDLSSELQINHKPECPYKACFFYGHIYIGTAKDNSQDYSKSKTYCKNGHELTSHNTYIIILRNGPRKGQQIKNCRECGKLRARKRRSKL